MSLRKSTGNMYGFIDYTWNPIPGICPFGCGYCYMRKFWPQMRAPRLNEKELRVDHGSGKTIFVGSGIDMFAPIIDPLWIKAAIGCCTHGNIYLFQSKNPGAFCNYKFPKTTVLCTTIETNRYYPKIMGKCPEPEERQKVFAGKLSDYDKMITIEPIMDFDLDVMMGWMLQIKPMQINIGADSGNNNLPEPTQRKIKLFINQLNKFGLKVHLKPNLNRLLNA